MKTKQLFHFFPKNILSDLIHKSIVAVIMFTLSLVFLNCKSARIDLPSGFAAFKNDSPNWQAVSADATQLRVRTTKNKPVGSLDVLTSTTELHFKTIGYTIIKNEAIQSDSGLDGRLFVTSVQTMNGNYRYLMAFFLDQENIHIVEATGQKKDFEKHQSGIIQKLKSLKP